MSFKFTISKVVYYEGQVEENSPYKYATYELIEYPRCADDKGNIRQFREWVVDIQYITELMDIANTNKESLIFETYTKDTMDCYKRIVDTKETIVGHITIYNDYIE